MKITFIFNNGTSQIHLHPESPRDERYLDMCIENRPQVRIIPLGKDKDVIIEFTEGEKKK